MKPNPNRLLVEGQDDKRVIPQLIEGAGIPWGDRPRDWIVHIESCGSVDEILKPGSIKTELKASNLMRLGIVIDADDRPERYWESIRNQCIGVFPALPEELDTEGVVVTNDEGLRFGVWMLPDNRSHGMMETFLAHLVPENRPLWVHCEQSAMSARDLGASFKRVHMDKALIHTWLAWQDPPGRQLHDALVQKILDPKSPHAAPFVRWFCRLYELECPPLRIFDIPEQAS